MLIGVETWQYMVMYWIFQFANQFFQCEVLVVMYSSWSHDTNFYASRYNVTIQIFVAACVLVCVFRLTR